MAPRSRRATVAGRVAVARTKLSIGLAPIVAGVATPEDDDDLTAAVLDATAELLADYGLRRWSVEDVADRAGVGRTSVYRKFESRDQLVHAVLARELRRTFAAIDAAVSHHRRLEDRAVEGALVALTELRGSLVERLLHSDPATFLPFLTTGAAPLLVIARESLATMIAAEGVVTDRQHAVELAEVVARLALSFILTRETAFPIGDEKRTRAALHRVIHPLLNSSRFR